MGYKPPTWAKLVIKVRYARKLSVASRRRIEKQFHKAATQLAGQGGIPEFRTGEDAWDTYVFFDDFYARELEREKKQRQRVHDPKRS